MLKIKITAGTSISTLIKRFSLFILYKIHNINHLFSRNYNMKMLTLKMTSFLKIIKFKSVRKRKVQGFVHWKVEWMISATVLQYNIDNSFSLRAKPWITQANINNRCFKNYYECKTGRIVAVSFGCTVWERLDELQWPPKYIFTKHQM